MTPDIVVVVELIQVPIEFGKGAIVNQLLEVESTAILKYPFIQRKEAA